MCIGKCKAGGTEKNGKNWEQRKITACSEAAKEKQRCCEPDSLLYRRLQMEEFGKMQKKVKRRQKEIVRARLCLAIYTNMNEQNNLSLLQTAFILTHHHPLSWAAVANQHRELSEFFFFSPFSSSFCPPVFSWINSPVHT